MTPQAAGKAPPIDFQLRAQVQALRKLGYLVTDICLRLDLHTASERASVAMICDALPRCYGHGLDTSRPVWRGPNAANRAAQ